MKKSINAYKIEVNMYKNEIEKINNQIRDYEDKIDFYCEQLNDYKDTLIELVKELVVWFFKNNLVLVIIKFVPLLAGVVVPSYVYPIAYFIFLLSFIRKNGYLIHNSIHFGIKEIKDNISSIEEKINDCSIEKEKIMTIIDCLGVLIEREIVNSSVEQNGLEQVKNDYINKPLVKS